MKSHGTPGGSETPSATRLSEALALIERLRQYNPPDRTIDYQRPMAEDIHAAADMLESLLSQSAPTKNYKCPDCGRLWAEPTVCCNFPIAPSSTVCSEETLKKALRPALEKIFDNLDDLTTGECLQILVDGLRDLDAPSVASAIAFDEYDATYAKLLRDTLRGNPYPTLGSTHTWQVLELWAEGIIRRADSGAKNG